MEGFQIGKDISNIEFRLASLEGRVRVIEAAARRIEMPPAQLGVPGFTHEYLDSLDLPKWENWKPPFPNNSGRGFADGGLGDGFASFKEPTGILTASAYVFGGRASLRGYQYRTTWFELFYRNSSRSGRVQVHSEWWCNRAYRTLHIIDNVGPSQLYLLMKQRITFRIFKLQGQTWAKILDSEQPAILGDEERDYGIGEGGPDQRSWDRRDEALIRGAITQLGADKDQWVSVQVGVSVYSNHWTDGYGINSTNDLDVRLDNFTVNLVD